MSKDSKTASISVSIYNKRKQKYIWQYPYRLHWQPNWYNH